MVQQQALRDFAQAMTAFFDPASPARRPPWRKAELAHAAGLTTRERRRMRRPERRLTRARSGSNRRGRVRLAIGRLRARETNRRKDWAEKTSTNIAEQFDVIRIENLKIRNMTR